MQNSQMTQLRKVIVTFITGNHPVDTDWQNGQVDKAIKAIRGELSSMAFGNALVLVKEEL
jgi:hypothetical protein